MFVKVIDTRTIKRAPLNLVLPDKTILNFRYNETLMREYGYKPLVEVEKDYSKLFHIEYEETETEIKEVIVYDPLVDDDPAIDNSSNTDPDPENIE